MLQKHGHRAARLDPLDLALRPSVPALDPRRYGFKLSRTTNLRPEFISETLPEPVEGLTDEQGMVSVQGILDFPVDESGGKKTIDEVQKRLEEVYCEGIGYEVGFLLFPLLGDPSASADALSHPTVHAPPPQIPSSLP